MFLFKAESACSALKDADIKPRGMAPKSLEPQLPSALSSPSAVPSSRWSTSSPKSGAWRWRVWQSSLRTREGRREGQHREPLPRDDFWGHKLWMTLIARHFLKMRLQLKIQLQSTFKNSLLHLKTRDDEKKPQLQPFLSASVTPACPGTVPIIHPSK